MAKQTTNSPESKVGAPAGLGDSGLKLWLAITTEWELQVYEELILVQACRAADRLDDLASLASESPITVTNFKGDQVAHPAIVESRQQAIVLSRLIASLRLPSGDAETEAKRPQRRGGARGTYGIRAVR